MRGERAYEIALVRYFNQENNGIHNTVLYSSWTPHGKPVEKGTIEHQKQDPTNPTRKVLCGCVTRTLYQLILEWFINLTQTGWYQHKSMSNFQSSRRSFYARTMYLMSLRSREMFCFPAKYFVFVYYFFSSVWLSAILKRH